MNLQEKLFQDDLKSEKYWWLTEESKRMLNGGYLLRGETVQKAVERICHAAAKMLKKPDLEKVFSEMVERGWMSLSSPIWANMGTERGLPISCFNVHIPDSIEGITYKLGEVITQTKIGGGTSGYFGSLRARGTAVKDNGCSSGAVSFMKLFDTTMDTISQGGVRRGAFAAYLDIDHPDIEEFLNIRSHNYPIQNLHFAVCIKDYWMQAMIRGDEEKRKVWAKVLQCRKEKGGPFLFFTDNVNTQKPKVYKDRQMMIKGSNLCTEIMLPSNDEESFICCLCSLNLELYDEWKDTDTVKMAIYFLDAVLEEFIAKTEGRKYLEAANLFAKRHRAVGLGVMGWHSYLQKNRIPFEGMKSKQLTYKIFKNISKRANKASEDLATIYGEPELLKGYKRRNTTVMAIAPTTSSASILGQVSQGIEPFQSNYYKVDLAKGNFMRKNCYLKELLKEKDKDTPKVWESILFNDGSVQHLDFLSQEEKNIFKSFNEINQLDIIQQASIRQQFIDQGQSLNLHISPETPVPQVNRLIIEAWQLGVKTLYYQRSKSTAKDFVKGEKNIITLSFTDKKDVIACLNCEG